MPYTPFKKVGTSNLPYVIPVDTSGNVQGSAAAAAAAGSATLTDKSGTITTGGTAQVFAAANASRRGASIQNNSTGDIWFSSLATAVVGQPSFCIPPKALYEFPAGGVPLTAISIVGATTGQAFTGREW